MATEVASDDAVDEPSPKLVRAIPLVAGGLALLLIAAVIGYTVGRGRPPGRDSVDVGFLYDMITHHEQAQYMANLELVNGTEEAVQVFAREILRFQSFEIGLMQAYLEEWGYAREDAPDRAMGWMGHPVARDAMPGMATEAQLGRLLQARGRDADALFVELMKTHHRGGIEMAAFASTRASDERVRALAARVAKNQRLEIGELEAARQRVGLAPPVG